MKWISTREALPEPEQGILVFFEGCIYTATFYGHCWVVCNTTGDKCDLDLIKYWMPLPNPPEE